jgi:nucleoside-diphosphate-sugar epimerase
VNDGHRPVLVTGATGFIGSHLARRLLADGAAVHVLVRSGAPMTRIDDIAGQLTIWPGDVTDAGSVDACIGSARPSCVFHLAGDTSTRHVDADLDAVLRSAAVNLMGTLHVLRSAARAGVGRVVRAGGLEEYGEGPLPFDEAQRERPISPYSASQVAAAHYAQMLAYHTPLEVVTLRPALVYGPGQAGTFFIPSLITHALEGRPFTRTGAGGEARDLLYIDDVVDGFLRAATAPDAAGRVINLGTGSEYLMTDVAEMIVRLAGTAIPIHLDERQRRRVDLLHLRCRTEQARALLGWTPRVELEDGLRRTLAWYRDAGTTAQRAGD